MVRNRDQARLSADESYQIKDLDPLREVGSMKSRRGHELVASLPAGLSRLLAVGEQTRLDGDVYLVGIGNSTSPGSEAEDGFLYIKSPAGEWTIRTRPNMYAGHDDVALDIRTDEIRTFGINTGWLGRITLEVDPTEASPATKFAANSGVEITDPIQEQDNILASADKLPLTFSYTQYQTHSPSAGYDVPPGTVYYGISIIYEGFQESPICDVISFTNDSGDHIVSVKITVIDPENFDNRIKRIRLYRAIPERLVADPLKDATFYHLADFDIYGANGELTDDIPWFYTPANHVAGTNQIVINEDDALRYLQHGANGRIDPGRIYFSIGDFSFLVAYVSLNGRTIHTLDSQIANLDAAFASVAIGAGGGGSISRRQRSGRRDRIGRDGATQVAANFWHVWDVYTEDSGLKASIVYVDTNPLLTDSYENISGAPQSVRYISPRRSYGRVFEDYAFYLNVEDEDGIVHPERVYYSHYNNVPGVHCPDIVLPANYFNVNFRPYAVASIGTHKAIIGDTGYAVGFFSGDPLRDWQIQHSSASIGCMAKNTITETPHGAMFLGNAGLYLLTGIQHQGPLAQEIWPDIEFHPGLDSARAVWSKRRNLYYLSIPASGDFEKLVYAFHIQSNSVRLLTAGSAEEIDAMGFGADGSGLIASDSGVTRLEVEDYEVGGLDIEYESRRMSINPNQQQIADMVGIEYSCRDVFGIPDSVSLELSIIGYPSGTEYVIDDKLAVSVGVTLKTIGIPNCSPDLSHSVRIKGIESHPTKVTIRKLYLGLKPHESTIEVYQ